MSGRANPEASGPRAASIISGSAPWATPGVPKASTLLANQLRALIVGERLAVGADLPGESEIIERTGFSRGTVREALRLLEAEGLIEIRRGPAGGIRVRHPDTDHVSKSMATILTLSNATLRELFAFRRLLEPDAVALAAKHATPAQRQRFVAFSAPDPSESVGETVGFHSLVADSCGNEFMKVTLGVVLNIAEWHTSHEDLDDLEMAAARAAHARIARHIARREGEAGARLMNRHLTAFEKVMHRNGRLDATVIRFDDRGVF